MTLFIFKIQKFLGRPHLRPLCPLNSPRLANTYLDPPLDYIAFLWNIERTLKDHVSSHDKSKMEI